MNSPDKSSHYKHNSLPSEPGRLFLADHTNVLPFNGNSRDKEEDMVVLGVLRPPNTTYYSHHSGDSQKTCLTDAW